MEILAAPNLMFPDEAWCICQDLRAGSELGGILILTLPVWEGGRRFRRKSLQHVARRKENGPAMAWPSVSGLQIAGVTRVFDGLGERGRGLGAIDANHLGRQVDQNFGRRIGTLDRLFNGTNAMRTGHVVDLKIEHLQFSICIINRVRHSKMVRSRAALLFGVCGRQHSSQYAALTTEPSCQEAHQVQCKQQKHDIEQEFMRHGSGRGRSKWYCGQ
ncbi:hypothetical protein ABIB57_005308 [Devosia sp. UYZn731]